MIYFLFFIICGTSQTSIYDPSEVYKAVMENIIKIRFAYATLSSSIFAASNEILNDNPKAFLSELLNL